jgi:hypothetical protein
LLYITDNTVTLFPATKGMHPATCNERGIFGLGNAYADEVALRWVLRHANSHSNGVVVYGSGVDALAAVGNLLKFIGASRITLVVPEKDFHDIGHQAVRNPSCHLTILAVRISNNDPESQFWNRCTRQF